MHREAIESSSLRSLGYDPATQTLEVEFRSGGVYRYEGVPFQVYSDLRDSESPGRTFTRQIRNSYECWKRLRPRREV